MPVYIQLVQVSLKVLLLLPDDQEWIGFSYYLIGYCLSVPSNTSTSHRRLGQSLSEVFQKNLGKFLSVLMYNGCGGSPASASSDTSFCSFSSLTCTSIVVCCVDQNNTLTTLKSGLSLKEKKITKREFRTITILLCLHFHQSLRRRGLECHRCHHCKNCVLLSHFYCT